MKRKRSNRKEKKPTPDGQIVDENGQPTGASVFTDEMDLDEATDDAWRKAAADAGLLDDWVVDPNSKAYQDMLNGGEMPAKHKEKPRWKRSSR